MMLSPSTPMPLDQAIDQLRQLTQTNVQASWHCCFEDLSPQQIEQWDWQSYPLADRNAKDHIAWAKGHRVIWLYQEFEVPSPLEFNSRDACGTEPPQYPVRGLTLRLALTWWAELAQIYINGQLVQSGDLFDCATRVILSAQAIPGTVIRVAIRLVSPGHDDGALVKSRLLYESADNCLDPGFVADELAVLHSYLTVFAPTELPTLAQAVATIDWRQVGDRPTFDRSLTHLRQTLQPLGERIKQHTLYLVGHAHLDMAWLWPVAETWSAAERTFRSVLSLQADFPDLTFCHSTPALYEWIEQHRPSLFAEIQAQMQAEGNRWEVVGGLWVEPELNIISSEAIARHLLYGQRYCQAKFGAINRVAWLPDSFGFCWQLPQLLQQSGIDYFVTQKLRWNDTTRFADQIFNWQSPDGSKILSLMSAPIGEGIDPLKMAAYTWEWVTQTGLPHPLWLPGVGDHGGGPTRDMLELVRRWQTSPFFPQLVFTTVVRYLDQLAATWASRCTPEATDPLPGISSETLAPDPPLTDLVRTSTTTPWDTKAPTLPNWNSELYLEFHRGCYTTHADQKRSNRDCEKLLYQAELWASMATIGTAHPYPQAALKTAWKQVLFNQFHDILPGSSIPQVFVDANQAWAAAANTASEVLTQALHRIASHIALPVPPHPKAQAIVVFNSLNWPRSQLITVDLPETAPAWQVLDLTGQAMKVQRCTMAETGDRPTHLSFLADPIPPLGYRVFWLCPHSVQGHLDRDRLAQTGSPIDGDAVLENEFLKITVDRATGDLTSVFDKQHQREVLSGPGNQLQAFQDQGQYWDAWNIDPNYANHPLPPAKLLRIEFGQISLGNGDRATLPPWSPSILVERQIGQSRFQQTYCLEPASPLLKISTVVDWQERHVMVKAAFPLTLNADYATYEMPAGAIQRPTMPQTDREKAQWEVPAMQWADLSNHAYGVSLLNDSKYGYDCQANQIRLTLLRGSEFPDPEADRGHHQFTYALYPHAGTWQSAHTVQRGYELNQPLHVLRLNPPYRHGPLPPIGSLINLGAENLILTAFKPSEDDPDTYLLRCYECQGHPADFVLTGDLGVRLGERVDVLERPIAAELSQIQPWQIASFRVARSSSESSPPADP